jgi:magnesium transporter
MQDDAPINRSSDRVGRYLVTTVATARSDETSEQVFARLTGQSFESLENVHVLDAQGRLIGLVPIARLLAASRRSPIAELMVPDHFAVNPEMDQERLLALARKHSATAPPVVDSDGRLLGCVPPRALIEIGWREHAEDISRMAGILHRSPDDRSSRALEEMPILRALHRLPWLLVGLVGSAVATLVMTQFEAQLEAQVVVAFFVPAIVYLADAIGTQTEAIVVRGLSYNAPSLAHLLIGEMSAGILIGAVLGAIAWPLVYGAFGSGQLASAVALAIAVAGPMASACGLFFPWLLSRAGLDPAFGSGPIATVIQDVITLVAYFWIVRFFLPA